MPDADRLREAADFCDAQAGFVSPESQFGKERRAQAIMLRAVADADEHLTYGIPSCVTLPALALADTILGMTE